MQVIGTHSGSIHADDAVGIAVLRALYPGASIVRSRDPAAWATCNALVDVGGEYNPLTCRFDHHQKGFSQRRQTGVPYAGAGLVWSAYGHDYVRMYSSGLTTTQINEVAEAVDARLIAHIDAVDNGVTVPGPANFSLSGIIDSLNGTWLEDVADDDTRFIAAVQLAQTVLSNLVKTLCAHVLAAEVVRAAEHQADGRILVLDTPRVPYDPVVCAEMPSVLFVVYPESRGEQYQVRVVPVVEGSFEARADLPEGWAGLQGAELAEVTGVADAEFCHNGRFICGARSKEGALALALKAVAMH